MWIYINRYKYSHNTTVGWEAGARVWSLPLTKLQVLEYFSVLILMALSEYLILVEAILIKISKYFWTLFFLIFGQCHGVMIFFSTNRKEFEEWWEIYIFCCLFWRRVYFNINIKRAPSKQRNLWAGRLDFHCFEGVWTWT